MATKTISIVMEACQRLTAARCEPRESFWQVIKRAAWDEEGKTCQTLLEGLSKMAVADDEVLVRLECAQEEDAVPDDPWS